MTPSTSDPRGDAARAAGLIQKALTDLGYTWKSQNGDEMRVHFASIEIGDIAGATWAVCDVDTSRLPRRVTANDLVRAETVHHLQTVVGLQVRCFNSTGITYCVRLTPPPPSPRLPTLFPLDLSDRPAGETMIPIGFGTQGLLWRPFPALGHTLVAGASGSGKSCWLHTAIAALASGSPPARVRFALIDPKQSEFAVWAKLAHLWAPCAYDAPHATELLAALVQEMDRRGALLAGALTRDLETYNRQAGVGASLPYLIVIVDEVLDILLEAGGERSDLARFLTRLAVKGRAAGIYLWVASQHARFDLLPRAVTINLASRLVFRVADAAAAQLAGCPGAEQIRRDRPGRFLARVDSGEPQPMQACYLNDAGLLAIARHLTGEEAPTATSSAPSPAITPEESELIHYALYQLGGAFTIGRLAAAFPTWKRHRIADLARRWEAAGLLTAPADAVSPRQVTPDLAVFARD